MSLISLLPNPTLLGRYTLNEEISSTLDSKPPESSSAKKRPNLSVLHGLMQKKVWYTDATSYWEDPSNCTADVEGILGGFGSLSPVDIKGSGKFVEDVLMPSFPPSSYKMDKGGNTRLGRVLDLGGGIGRVSKHLLSGYFSSVTMMEVSPRLCKAASEYVNECSNVEVVNTGMEGWRDFNGVDVVWAQWCIGHFTDGDFVDFLIAAREGMGEGGKVVVKDNVAVREELFVYDEEDSSVTRSEGYLDAVFATGGWRRLGKWEQEWPEELFPVPIIMYGKA